MEPDTCAQRAGMLGDLTGTPLVLMGHTHTVDHRFSSDGRVEYANSGTWTSVGNPWNRLMRDARRLTLLHVEGKKVHLRRWNDDAGRLDDVPLFRLDDNSFAEKTVMEERDVEEDLPGDYRG